MLLPSLLHTNNNEEDDDDSDDDDDDDGALSDEDNEASASPGRQKTYTSQGLILQASEYKKAYIFPVISRLSSGPGRMTLLGPVKRSGRSLPRKNPEDNQMYRETGRLLTTS